MEKDAETAIRRELEATGEAKVFSEFWGSGGLSNTGVDKDRLWVTRQWLREKERGRNIKLKLVAWISFVVAAALFLFALDIISDISERYQIVCEGRFPSCKPIFVELELLALYALAAAIGTGIGFYMYARPKEMEAPKQIGNRDD